MRYRRPLLAYCRRLGLSESRAEDALQQALLQAWLALQGAAEVQALSPWLYRIVHNTAINVIRSSRNELALGADAAAAEALPAPGIRAGECERCAAGAHARRGAPVDAARRDHPQRAGRPLARGGRACARHHQRRGSRPDLPGARGAPLGRCRADPCAAHQLGIGQCRPRGPDRGQARRTDRRSRRQRRQRCAVEGSRRGRIGAAGGRRRAGTAARSSRDRARACGHPCSAGELRRGRRLDRWQERQRKHSERARAPACCEREPVGDADHTRRRAPDRACDRSRRRSFQVYGADEHSARGVEPGRPDSSPRKLRCACDGLVEHNGEHHLGCRRSRQRRIGGRLRRWVRWRVRKRLGNGVGVGQRH
jgi:hypothetical protein